MIEHLGGYTDADKNNIEISNIRDSENFMIYSWRSYVPSKLNKTMFHLGDFVDPLTCRV